MLHQKTSDFVFKEIRKKIGNNSEGYFMKHYLIFIFKIIVLSITFNGYANCSIKKCNCLDALRGYNKMYKKAWIGDCTEKSHPYIYPYYLTSASIKSQMIFNPSHYFEYYQNLHVFNES